MRKQCFLVVLATLAAFAGTVNAQRAADKYLVSAQAGGVNSVNGSVTRVGIRTQQLIQGEAIGVGETVVTGENGRLEVLMNPGSFIRVGPNSEFAFASVSLDDLRVSLNRGSAIFEVYATDKFQVKVTTPSGVVMLADSGVYRFDLDDSGNGVLAVIKGKAAIAGRTDFIKDGREVQIGTNTLAVKFDKKSKADELSIWSRDRSKELAKVSSSLAGSSLNNTLLSSFAGGQFGLYNSFGLWVFDRSRSGYCFLPFGFGWRSPYGFDVMSGIDWWQLQRMTNNPAYFPRGYQQGGGINTPPPTTVANSNPAPPPGPVAGDHPMHTREHPRTELPPFADVQRQQRVNPGFDRGDGEFRGRRTDGGSRGIEGPTTAGGFPSQNVGGPGSTAGAPMQQSAPAAPEPSRARGGKVSPIDN